MATSTRVIKQMSEIVQPGDCFLIPDANMGFGSNGKHRPWVVVEVGRKRNVAIICPRTTKIEKRQSIKNRGYLHTAQLHNGFSKTGMILKRVRRTVSLQNLASFHYVGQVSKECFSQPKVASKKEIKAALEECIPEIARGKVEVARISIDPITRHCRVSVTAEEPGIDSAYACKGCRDLRRREILEKVRGIRQIEFCGVGG